MTLGILICNNQRKRRKEMHYHWYQAFVHCDPGQGAGWSPQSLFCVSGLSCLRCLFWEYKTTQLVEHIKLHWISQVTIINSPKYFSMRIKIELKGVWGRMATRGTLVRLLLREAANTSSSSVRPSSTLSTSKNDIDAHFTSSSVGLPRVKEVHHPNRVKDNVLHPAFDIDIPEVVDTKNLSFSQTNRAKSLSDHLLRVPLEQFGNAWTSPRWQVFQNCDLMYHQHHLHDHHHYHLHHHRHYHFHNMSTQALYVESVVALFYTERFLLFSFHSYQFVNTQQWRLHTSS